MRIKELLTIATNHNLTFNQLMDILLLYQDNERFPYITEMEESDLLNKGIYLQIEDEIQLNVNEVEKIVNNIDMKSVSMSKIDWTIEWNELFTTILSGKRVSLKTPNSRVLKSNQKDVDKKMIRFLKDYKQSKETIFEATKLYLSEQEKEQYQYCKESAYFIYKGGEGSQLAKYCDMVNNDENIETNRRNKMK